MENDAVYYELLELNRLIDMRWPEFMTREKVGVVLSSYVNRTPPRIVILFDPLSRIKRSEKHVARDSAKRFVESIVPGDFKCEIEEERDGEIIYTITARESSPQVNSSREIGGTERFCSFILRNNFVK